MVDGVRRGGGADPLLPKGMNRKLAEGRNLLRQKSPSCICYCGSFSDPLPPQVLPVLLPEPPEQGEKDGRDFLKTHKSLAEH